MEKLQEFIKDYFSLLNLRKMSEPVKKRYDKMVGNNDFPNKTVKAWAGYRDDTSGEWKKLPNFSGLSDKDLNVLYLDLLKTFNNMNAHKTNLDDETKKFITAYFGAGKTFDVPDISNATKQKINGLIQTVLQDSNIRSAAELGFYDDENLEAILNGQKKHEDESARQLIFGIIQRLQKNLDPSELPFSQDELLAIQKSIKPFGLSDVTKDNRDALKTNAPDIFAKLFKTKKTFEAFKKYEPDEKIISESIDSALYNTDYTGKINAENYIAPKYEDDQKNLHQKINEALENTYSDVLKKYLTLHRANLTMTKCAPAIIKQLDKAKIKPTDGLKALIDEKEGKKDAIIQALKGKEPFKAAEYFEWMTNKLVNYKKNGLDKAIEGALYNRRQMERIIEQIIFDAVKEDKIEQAKTAMEILSVMQYGMFTSRRMDAINQTDITLFSDKDLSWNKNDGIRFVTKATDRTIKAGIQLAGYATTAIANKVFRRPSRVLNKSSLEDKVKEEQQNILDEKADFLSDKNKQDRADNKILKDNRKELKSAVSYFRDKGIKNLKQAEKILTVKKTEEEEKLASLETAEQNFAPWEQYKSDYERLMQISVERVNLSREIGNLRAELKALPNPAPNQQAEFEAATKKQKLTQLNTALNELENESNALKARYPGTQVDKETGKAVIVPFYNIKHKNITYADAKKNRDKAEQEYTALKNDDDILEQNINNYKNAKFVIKETKEQKADRKKEADEWDEKHKNGYAELWAHWDFLQSGNTKSLFHLSTKKLQKKMDAGEMQNKYNKFYANWLKSHSYAA